MNPTATKAQLQVIGSTEFIEIAGIKNIPAKIDTGADTSAIWASNIDMQPDGTLVFSLFAKGSPFYTGDKLKTIEYRAKHVRSSHGDRQVRYRVKLPVTVGDKTFDTTFTLANRSRNHFPVLLGRHTLDGRYLVDVSRGSVPRNNPAKSTRLSTELRDHPYEFHQKYIKQKKGKYEHSDSI